MVLDESLENVMAWFEGRDYKDMRIAVEVLDARGYTVEEVPNFGSAGGMRRILTLVKEGEIEGHAVAVDDDESIVDPQSTATTKKYLLDYTYTGYRLQKVYVLKRKAISE
jgi:hypothetical protein